MSPPRFWRPMLRSPGKRHAPSWSSWKSRIPISAAAQAAASAARPNAFPQNAPSAPPVADKTASRPSPVDRRGTTARSCRLRRRPLRRRCTACWRRGPHLSDRRIRLRRVILLSSDRGIHNVELPSQSVRAQPRALHHSRPVHPQVFALRKGPAPGDAHPVISARLLRKRLRRTATKPSTDAHTPPAKLR